MSRAHHWQRVYLLSARSTLAIAALVLLAAVVLEASWTARWLALLLFALLALPLYLLTGRLRFSLLLAALPLDTIYLASKVKQHFLDAPLLFFDAHYLTGTHLFDLAVVYVPLTLGILASLALMAALLVLVWRMDQRRPHSLWPWLLVLLLPWPLALVYQRLAGHGLTEVADPWQILSAHDRVFESFFVSGLHREPRLWPVAAASAPAPAPEGMSPPDAAALPELFTILQESTFDPNRLLRYCAIKPCVDRDFTQPEISGLMKVHTFGGGTWMSEFSYLVGLPHLSLGPAGYYAPHTMMGRVRHSLPQYLKGLGYATIAIYPTEGEFINASAFYRSIGFDEFLDLADLGLGGGQHPWRIPDQVLFDGVLKHLPAIRTRHAGKPLFVFLLTLAQHGPHGPGFIPKGSLPDARAPAAYPAFTRLALSDYLRRMDKGAAAFSRLRQALQKVAPEGRRSLVLHWGDHHPEFSNRLPAGDFTLGDAPDYTTYYALHGAAKDALDPDMMRQRLDIAYLSTLLIKSAGLPLDEVFQLRERAWRDCGGRYAGCDKPVIGELHRLLLDRGLLEVQALPSGG
jgi:phosphoglycerol transferase MdoB-like AlkP superfamily enzyme